MAEYAGLIGAIAALASAGTGIAGAAGAFNPPQPKAPTMPRVPEVSTQDMARRLLPGVTANAAATSGGGMSPEFLANLVTNATGEPGAGLDILADIRRGLGGPGI